MPTDPQTPPAENQPVTTPAEGATPAAAAPVPEKKPAPAKPITEAESKSLAKFAETWGGSARRKAATDTKPTADGAPKPEGEKPEGEKPAETPETKPAPVVKKKPAAKPAPKPLTEEQIARAAARGAAEGVRAATPPAAETTPKPAANVPEPLPEENQYVTEVLSHLEAMPGMERYKGIGGKYQESVRNLIAYQDKWKKANPGQEFDDQAPEHEEFFSKNDVDFEDGDFDRAKVSYEAKKIVASETKETHEKLADMERREKLREIEPELAAHRRDAGRQFFSLLGDEYKNLFDGEGAWNNAEAERLKAADPKLWKQIIDSSRALTAEMTEHVKLIDKRLAKFDPRNPVHAAIDGLLDKYEAEIQALPENEQLDGANRPFLKVEDWLKLKPEERNRFWTLTAENFRPLRARDLAAWVNQNKAEREREFNELAQARGLIPKPNPGTTGTPQNGQPPKPHGTTTAKPASPSTVGAPRMAATRGVAPNGQKPGLNRFLSGFGTRSLKA